MPTRSTIAAGGVCLVALAVVLTVSLDGPAATLAGDGSDFPGPRKTWTPQGQMDTAVVRESSGIIKSRQFPGVFWTHSDSLNEPIIFAVNEAGRILARVPIGAANWDWEDIAADDQGFLYIADIGNNFGWFSTRTIYKIAEPDPYAGPHSLVAPVATYSYQCPRKQFDAEGFFTHRDRMFLVTKRGQQGTEIYRLDPGPNGASKLQVMTTLPPVSATAADLSPDGTLLAICTARMTWIYRVNDDMVPVKGVEPLLVRYPPDGVEGCCFDDGDLVLTNEAGRIFRISAGDIRAGTVFIRSNNRKTVRDSLAAGRAPRTD